jgi:ribonuclease P protein component
MPRAIHEADLSTEPIEAQAAPWISRPHANEGRPQGAEQAPSQGPEAALRLSQSPPRIGFLKKRADFLALRSGDRAHAPSFLVVRRRRGDGDSSVRFGLTVTKKLGGAVVRNRIRRRLREAARRAEGAEPGCDYLLIARAAAHDRPWPQLLDDLRRALLSLRRTS